LRSYLVKVEKEFEIYHLFESCANKRNSNVPETLLRQNDRRFNTFKLSTKCSVDGKETIIIFDRRPFDGVYLEEPISKTYEGFYRFNAGLKFWR